MSRRVGSSTNVPDKVIDTWYYKVKDVEYMTREYVSPEDDERDGHEDLRNPEDRYDMRKQRIVNKLVSVKVKLCKTTTQSEEPPHPTRDVSFLVVCEEHNIRMQGTDIEALRTAVWELLDKKYAIKWEYYYLVQVNRERCWRGSGTGLSFNYDGVYKGTTWDGKLLLKKYDGSEYKIKPWPGEFKDEQDKVIACIPATDMNREALDEFCRRIDRLREMLADFLRPDVIMQTLSNLAGMALLPPATKEDEKDRTNSTGAGEG